MGDERRQDPRIPLRAQADVRFASWEVFRFIYTMNISRGGMSLILPKKPEVGAKLTVRLLLPHGGILDLPAEVRHAKEVSLLDPSAGGGAGFRVGVAFEGMDAARRSEIEKLIMTRGVPPRG